MDGLAVLVQTALAANDNWTAGLAAEFAAAGAHSVVYGASDGTLTRARRVEELAALLPGALRLPPIDRDESRYAQATKQMLETKDFVRIRFQDEPRNKKPAGVHWMQAASRRRACSTAGPRTPSPRARSSTASVPT